MVTARLGLWRLYTAGLVVSAISALTFSLLTWLPGPTAFLAAAYTLRLLEGLGGAALWTSMLALLLSRSVIYNIFIANEFIGKSS